MTYFPIKIKFENGTELIVNRASDIPSGKSFIVIKVNT